MRCAQRRTPATVAHRSCTVPRPQPRLRMATLEHASNLHPSLAFVASSGGTSHHWCPLPHFVKNGMRVLLLEDHTAPVLTVQVTYHVGSRNEAIGYTGATHLLEHLMFKGAKEYNKDNGNTIWSVLQRVGAQVNATTWLDRTNYYALLPSEHLEEAMKIEADRMRDAFIREEDRAPEMTVVRNEFERGENEPSSALRKEVWAAAFVAHPYHHPTIGWQSDIEKVPIERLREFYHQFYWPNNATLTVVGDFMPERAAALVDAHFGKIPRSPHTIPLMYTAEPPQTGQRRVMVRRGGAGASLVMVAHKTPPGLHPDTSVLKVLQKILSYGKNARLYRALQDKGLASRVHVMSTAFKDGGLFESIAVLTPGTELDKVEAIIHEEYETLKSGITEEELQRVKSQIRTEAALARDGSLSIASKLNEAIAIGDWKFFTSEPARIEAVTTEQVKLAAQAYLVENNMTVGHFIPRTTPLPAPPSVVDAKSIEAALAAAHVAPKGAAVASKGISIAERCAQLTPLPGMQLLVMPTSTPDVVAIDACLFGGPQQWPEKPMISRVLSAMLDQGTKKRSKFEVSEKLEGMGASVHFWPTEWHLNWSTKCLSKDVDAVLEVVAEELREPLFAAEDLETVKKRLLGEREIEKNTTRKQVEITYCRMLFPPGHPNWLNTSEEEIEQINSITVDELVRFHAEVVGRSSQFCIAAAGDIAPEAMAAIAKKHFGSLPHVEGVLQPAPVPGKLHPTATPVIHRIEEKKSADVLVGLATGINRRHADFYPFVLANYILGGNFSSRLNQVVRDKKGLTYGIRSSVEGADPWADAHWQVWATFAPQKLAEGLAAINVELTQLVHDGVTEKELEHIKTTLIGSHAVSLADSKGFASNLITNYKRGWPLSFLDDYPNVLRRATLAEVNAALRKCIHLDKLTTVVAGTVVAEDTLPHSKI